MSLVKISQARGRVPVTIFQVQDRINLENFAELEETVKGAYDNGMRDLVLDLSQAVPLSSIGIRAIVVIHKMLSAEGVRHFKIANPTTHIREVLDLAGVTDYVEVYDTIEEALASF